MKTSLLNTDHSGFAANNTSPDGGVLSARQTLFDRLMTVSRDESNNTRYVASMLSSWLTNYGVMPAQLGLTDEDFSAMLQFFFPDYTLPQACEPKDDHWLQSMPEKEDLESLFQEMSKDDQPQRRWIAAMVIAGCAGHQHLWEDMGLFSRKDLSHLLMENFPMLASRNHGDMKWKKFIYKQLCERSNINACPAPSCLECKDFEFCFASEDQPSAEIAH